MRILSTQLGCGCAHICTLGGDRIFWLRAYWELKQRVCNDLDIMCLPPKYWSQEQSLDVGLLGRDGRVKILTSSVDHL